MTIVDMSVSREHLCQAAWVANHGFALAFSLCLLFWAVVGLIVF